MGNFQVSSLFSGMLQRFSHAAVDKLRGAAIVQLHPAAPAIVAGFAAPVSSWSQGDIQRLGGALASVVKTLSESAVIQRAPEEVRAYVGLVDDNLAQAALSFVKAELANRGLDHLTPAELFSKGAATQVEDHTDDSGEAVSPAPCELCGRVHDSSTICIL